MSQTDIAKAMGVSPPAVSRLENALITRVSVHHLLLHCANMQQRWVNGWYLILFKIQRLGWKGV